MKRYYVRILLFVLFLSYFVEGGSVWFTDQRWFFDTSSANPVPEMLLNPFGAPVAQISGEFGFPPPFWNSGFWYGPTISIKVELPNMDIKQPETNIVINIGFKGNLDLSEITVTPIPGTPITQEPEILSRNMDTSDTGGVVVLTDVWTVKPNPLNQTIVYSVQSVQPGVNASVDYITVSTECMPEPITLSFVSIGLLFLMRYRRK